MPRHAWWLTGWAFQNLRGGTIDASGSAIGGAAEVLAVTTGGERERTAQRAGRERGGESHFNGGAGSIVCVRLDGTMRLVASELRWPHGIALLDNERTLVVADSHAEQLFTRRPVVDEGGPPRWDCRNAGWAPLLHLCER